MAKTRDEGGAVILQFPSVRREPSAIEAVARLAPSRSLVDSLLAEAGIAAHDAAAGMARELAHQLRALEAGEGSDGAIIRLRRLVDAHVLHAMDLCREYQVAGGPLDQPGGAGCSGGPTDRGTASSFTCRACQSAGSGDCGACGCRCHGRGSQGTGVLHPGRCRKQRAGCCRAGAAVIVRRGRLMATVSTPWPSDR